MTEDRANNNGMPLLAQGAFDAFVGFVYATTITLVIRTAYLEPAFKSVGPVVLTLALLLFFSQDWMVRVVGRLRISRATTKSPALFVVKLLIEITIAYFLLLASLTFVKIYTSGTEWAWGAQQQSMLGYTTAAFAVFCGLWNWVMIDISPDVNREQIETFFFKFHLDDKIVKQFPTIRVWLGGLRKDMKDILELVAKNTKQADEASNSDSSHVEQSVLRTNRWLYWFYGWRSIFWSLSKRPHHLFLPYLLVLHVAILNLVLGVFIAVSTWMFDGKSLLEGLFPDVSLFAILSTCAVLLLSTFVFLGIHFARSWLSCEKFGLVSLEIFILLSYCALPLLFLVLLLVVQQIFANFSMTRLFKTSPPSPSAPAGPAGQQSCVEAELIAGDAERGAVPRRLTCPLFPEGLKPLLQESDVDQGEGQP